MEEKSAKITFGLTGWSFVMNIAVLVVSLFIGKRVIDPLQSNPLSDLSVVT